MKRIKIEWTVFLACLFSVLLCCVSAFGEDCEKIRENTLRLHILANSDEQVDQEIKLAVRDAVLAKSGDLFSGARSRDELAAMAKRKKHEIETIVQNTLLQNDNPGTAEVEITEMFFETRVYENVVMPAGRYTALRVKIGEAKGKNWWCVLYPPLCVNAVSTGFSEQEAELANNLLQQGDYPQYKVKLAVVEWWESFWEFARGK